MRKQSFWAGICLALSILAGTLIADVIRVRQAPMTLDPNPRVQFGPGATGKADAEPVRAPSAETSADPAEGEQTPEMAWITAEAEALLADFMAEAWTDSEATDWARDYTSEGRFILEDTDGSRWITLTAARVPCERVDRFLAKQDDPGFGKPDRCDRWLRAAAQSMTKYGITDRTPGEFLKQINADLRVRVMLVYAGWYKDPNRPERIQLVDARPVIVYPETGFTEERREAEHAVFQAMKIGSDSHLEP